MTVFITGGTGYIGSQIVKTLQENGFHIKMLSRMDIDSRNSSVQIIPGNYLDILSKDCPWLVHLNGCDILVNAIGIIRETSHSSFIDVHQKAPIELFKQAKSHGVKKIIQLSALGADDQATTQYHITKRTADELLAQLVTDKSTDESSINQTEYTILRPSLVYGKNDISMKFFTQLSLLPITPIPGNGEYLLQPIYIDDLTSAVKKAITTNTMKNKILNLGGSEILTLTEMLKQLKEWSTGNHYFLKVYTPIFALKIMGTLTDLLGGNGPISTEELSMLLRGNSCQNNESFKFLDSLPLNFKQGLLKREDPGSYILQQKVTLAEPILRVSIALIWWITIFACLTDSGKKEMIYYLSLIGIEGTSAELILYFTLAIEFIFGATLFLKYKMKIISFLQMAVISFFTITLSIIDPGLWLHPFGVLSKNLALLAGLLILFIIQENKSSTAHTT